MTPEKQLPAVRASDAEREQVVAELREHSTQGRLTLEEFSQRVDEAYAAKTLAELEDVKRELPAVSATPDTRPRRRAHRWLVSIMGGADRKGRWRVPRRMTALSVMGGCDLDFRQAQIEDDEVTITVVSIMGGADIYVPEGIEVDLSGLSLMGGTDEHGRDAPPRPGTPLIRLRVFTLMGGTDVYHVPGGLGERSLREIRKRVET
jgi:uncharacterized protein DUF1707/cell wall-active antibiotic response 4TMS protein YvqF